MLTQIMKEKTLLHKKKDQILPKIIIAFWFK